jgi:hypothetical protein
VGNATVRLFLNGEPIASFSARPGRFRTHEIPVSFSSEGPLRLEILVDDPNPEKLGLAVDWIRIEGARFRLRSAMAPDLLAGVFVRRRSRFLLPRRPRSARRSLGQAVWFASDPFGMTHAEAQIAIVGVRFVALRVGFPPLGPLPFLLGYMLKGAALPSQLLIRRASTAATSRPSRRPRGYLERESRQKVAETAYPSSHRRARTRSIPGLLSPVHASIATRAESKRR